MTELKLAMTKKLTSIIISIVFMVAQWTFLLLSHYGYSWAWNIFTFWMWALTIIAVIALLGASARLPEVNRAIGNVLPAISDIGIATACAAMGHFGYAAMAIIQMLIELLIFNKPKESTNE